MHFRHPMECVMCRMDFTVTAISKLIHVVFNNSYLSVPRFS